MANFGPKPWISPFGKMSVFLLFELLLFITLKVVSSFENIIKHIFMAYIAKQNMAEKWPLLDQIPCINNFGKMSIFRLFELVF